MSFNQSLLLLCCFFGIVVVLYLSWLPNPNIGYLPFFPKWLGNWTNQNANLRTAIPFIFLGFSGFYIPFFNNHGDYKKAMFVLFILLGIVTIAEIGQLLQPDRYFDLADIGWGVIGSLLGLINGAIFRWFFKKYV